MKILLAICVAVLLVGCGVELGTPEDTRLTGDYHYLWNYDADPPELQIGRRTSKSGYSILIENVVAYGWTSDFIVAKCRPSDATNGASDTILKINKTEPDESAFGGLTHEDFVRKRTELAIPENLNFARDYE